MTTENAGPLFGEPGAGQPLNPPANGGQGGEPNAGGQVPSYVTEARMLQLLEQNRREMQSRLAKETNSRKRHLEELKAQGVTLTPETEREFMRTTALADDEPTTPTTPTATMQQPAQAGSPTGVQSAPPPAGAQPNWKSEKYETLTALDEYQGINLLREDPEFLAMPQTDDKKAFTVALKKALDAKKQRLADQSRGQAQGRLPSLPASGPAGDLLGAYQTELAKLPRGDVDQRQKLKAKYRQQGLSI